MNRRGPREVDTFGNPVDKTPKYKKGEEPWRSEPINENIQYGTAYAKSIDLLFSFLQQDECQVKYRDPDVPVHKYEAPKFEKILIQFEILAWNVLILLKFLILS